jgi:hypothetical protein
MKNILILLTIGLIFTSCRDYRKGDPRIMTKDKMLDGSCRYTWEGDGMRETFEDDCDAYKVGDKIPWDK